MHVDEDLIDVAQLAERGLDLRERAAARAQIQVAAEVDHAEALASRPGHDAGAMTGLAAQEVRRAQDPRLGVQIRVDLAAMVGVVAERDRVDPAREQLIGRLRRDSQPAGDVLAVDDDERRLQALAQQRQALEQGAPPDTADEIADEQDPHLPTHALAGSVLPGERLSLSHTWPMAAGGCR